MLFAAAALLRRAVDASGEPCAQRPDAQPRNGCNGNVLARPGRMPPAHRPKSPIERLLSPIAEVRREEAASVLVMTLLMFLLLAAYYMLKTAREVFILTEGGAEIKSYSSAGQAVLLLVPGARTARWPRA